MSAPINARQPRIWRSVLDLKLSGMHREKIFVPLAEDWRIVLLLYASHGLPNSAVGTDLEENRPL